MRGIPVGILPSNVSEDALRASDIAVFAPSRKARGARVHVMRPGWMCMLVTRTAECPHGGISPLDATPVPSVLLPDLVCGRAVTYTLSAVEKLLESYMSSSAVESDDLGDSEGDDRIRRRMQRCSLVE